jgi:serralysin
MCIACALLRPDLHRPDMDYSGFVSLVPVVAQEPMVMVASAVPGLDGLPVGQQAFIEVGDLAGNVNTVANLALGQSAYGQVAFSGDTDWYRVELTAGETYEFRMMGFGRQGVQLNDPLLRLMDANGNQLAANDDAGAIWGGGNNNLDSRLVFTAQASGTYYVSGEAFSDLVGNYLLSAVRQDPGGMVFTSDEIAWQLLDNGNTFFGGGSSSTSVFMRWDTGANNTLTFNITALSAAEQTMARNALATWSAVTGIQFQEINTNANLNFNNNEAGTRAYCATSWNSQSFIVSANIMITQGWVQQFGTTLDSYSYQTYVHEIGHALGLAHGGNYNQTANYPNDAFYRNDSLQYSIMSYMGSNNTFVAAGPSTRVLGPQIADILAVQALYGNNSTAFSGNTTYGVGSNTGIAAIDNFASVVVGGVHRGVMTIFDTGGVDTVNASTSAAAQRIDLREEAFSNVFGGRYNLAIARGVVVENAIGGSGADVLMGNDAGNALTGNGGLDVLSGLAGNDWLDGGAGGDQINGGADWDTASYGGSLTWVVVGLAGSGWTNFNDAAGDVINADVEALFGTVFNDYLGGNAAGNSLNGNDGDDGLWGYGGADYLYGGIGNDALFGGEGGDVLNGAEGWDTARYDEAATGVIVGLDGSGWVNFGEAAGDTFIDVEAIFATNFQDFLGGNNASNALYGRGGADGLYGNGGVDFLYGGTDNDTIEGGTEGDLLVGEQGFDVLTGGTGADTFLWNAGDGPDFITDFSTISGDVIRLVGSGFTSFAQLQGAITQTAGQPQSEINLGGGQILYVWGVTPGQFSADDFLFA